MKTKNILLTTAALLVSGLAFAGAERSVPIVIEFNEDGSGAAYGDMVTARFSDNDIELIGCGIRFIDIGLGDTYEWGFCQANFDDGSEEGLFAQCFTEQSKLLEAVKATSSYAFVRFQWNAEGDCTVIGFSTQSQYIPDFRDDKMKKSKKGKKGD